MAGLQELNLHRLQVIVVIYRSVQGLRLRCLGLYAMADTAAGDGGVGSEAGGVLREAASSSGIHFGPS